VILDFVMNHTSSQHPWFIESASSPSSAKRDWYVWSATNPGWHQPWGGDYPTWYLKNGAYYYGLFWSEMPDLNYKTPAVKEEMFRLGRLWLNKGVDGFRLDATRYLVETAGGAGQADTAETHSVLRDFAADVHATRRDAILIAENTVDTATLASYYADGVMNFDFPLASAIIDGVKSGDAARIRSTLAGILATYPRNVIDTPFLANHDHTRIATQLGSDAGKLRSAAAILLTLPGTPFIYYGEEVGLQNGPTSADESKRTPMPWSASGGFTAGAPWESYAPGLAVNNVASETNDPQSLLSYYRDWIAKRKQSAALSKGDLTLLETGPQVLAFTRAYGGERVVVAHNLGSSPASVDLPVGRMTLEPHGSAVWPIR
jgi:alpha-amylase